MWVIAAILWSRNRENKAHRRSVGSYLLGSTIAVPVGLTILTIVADIYNPTHGEPGFGVGSLGIILIVLVQGVLIPLALIANGLIALFPNKNNGNIETQIQQQH